MWARKTSQFGIYKYLEYERNTRGSYIGDVFFLMTLEIKEHDGKVKHLKNLSVVMKGNTLYRFSFKEPNYTCNPYQSSASAL